MSRTVSLPSVAQTPTAASVPTDSAFRCALALILLAAGQWLTLRGARVLSERHPARRAWESSLANWNARLNRLPWRGCVPSASWITPTQLAWTVLAVLVLNALLHLMGLPHVDLPGEPLERVLGR